MVRVQYSRTEHSNTRKETRGLMIYALTLDFTDTPSAQLWIEDTFDLSLVNILGIWPSPVRSQRIAKVDVTVDEEVAGCFDNALNQMVRPSYGSPDKARKLLYWEKPK
jgi:hypothetical protein